MFKNKQIVIENAKDFFREFRLFEFFEKREDGKSYQTNVKQMENEMFFSINYVKDGKRKSKRGYVIKNKKINRIFSTIYSDRRSNDHIELIEWDNCFNVVCESGNYIASRSLRMDKKQIFELFNL